MPTFLVQYRNRETNQTVALGLGANYQDAVKLAQDHENAAAGTNAIQLKFESLSKFPKYNPADPDGSAKKSDLVTFNNVVVAEGHHLLYVMVETTPNKSSNIVWENLYLWRGYYEPTSTTNTPVIKNTDIRKP